MVHPRKISFTESRGSRRFCNNKVMSDFGEGHFLREKCLLLPFLNTFFSQRGTPRIWMKLISPKLFALVLWTIYRVRHMSWYGISNGLGTQTAKATPTKFFTALH